MLSLRDIYFHKCYILKLLSLVELFLLRDLFYNYYFLALSEPLASNFFFCIYIYIYPEILGKKVILWILLVLVKLYMIAIVLLDCLLDYQAHNSIVKIFKLGFSDCELAKLDCVR